MSAWASGLDTEEGGSGTHCLYVLCSEAQAPQPLCFCYVSSGNSWAMEERKEWG